MTVILKTNIMNQNNGSFFAGTLIFLTILLITCGGVTNTSEYKQEKSQLAEEIKGVWIYVSEQGQAANGTVSGNRIKFITDKHWNITQSDPNTGVTIFHHGGTFKMNGDEYVETINYANENTSNMIDQSFTFKMEVKGDTLIQTGVGNIFNEIWKRAE